LFPGRVTAWENDKKIQARRRKLPGFSLGLRGRAHLLMAFQLRPKVV
jgi:hypothetical protein